jgi:pilus assembly protein CpaE
LLADLDLDAGMVGFFMKSHSSYTVLDAVSSLHRLDVSYWKALVSNGTPGVEVIKAPPAISPRQPEDQQRLRYVLNFVRSHYDWVVADFGRTLSPPLVDALEEVDEAFLVTTLDLPALHQAKQIANRLRDSGCGERLRLVLNRVPRRTDITTDEVRELLNLEVTAALPDGSNELYESYADGKLLPPDTNLARHLAALTSKICGVPLQAHAKRKFSLLG